MWNFNLCKDFHVQQIPHYWCLPLIQGFVDYQCPSSGLEMVIIARRKWAKGGTRFNARGIDDEGNCANWCELEHLVYSHKVLAKPESLNSSDNLVSTT
jgi:hypothetical protein